MKNEAMDLVEKLAPSEMKKEIVHGVRAGYMGAPATPGVIAPTVGRERERERERNKIRKLWIIVITWTNWKLIREPLGTSWPLGGSSCSGWRVITAEENEPQAVR
jgi:hypothetical protein